MALLNHAKKELSAKIVYYGPGLSGKTTNLEWIHRKLSPEKRGKLISLETKTDRTLFFDFLPVQIGDICGYSTRFNVYTVPGQIFYNETRRVVLKGVDGVVFVADSQKEMANENLENLKNLAENLRSIGKELFSIPLALQFNKRDLPNSLSVEELNGILNPKDLPYFESIAMKGEGVLPVLSHITRMVAEHLQDTLFPSSRDKAAQLPDQEASKSGNEKDNQAVQQQESVSVAPSPKEPPKIIPEQEPIQAAPPATPKGPAKKPPPLPSVVTTSPPIAQPDYPGAMANNSLPGTPPAVPGPIMSAPETPTFIADETKNSPSVLMSEPASLFENPAPVPPLAPAPAATAQTATTAINSAPIADDVPAPAPSLAEPELPTFLVDEPGRMPPSPLTGTEPCLQEPESHTATALSDPAPHPLMPPQNIAAGPASPETAPMPDLPIMEVPDIGDVAAVPAVEPAPSPGNHPEAVGSHDSPGQTISAPPSPLVTLAAEEMGSPESPAAIDLLLGSPARKAQNEIKIPIALRLEGSRERISFQLSIKIEPE